MTCFLSDSSNIGWFSGRNNYQYKKFSQGARSFDEARKICFDHNSDIAFVGFRVGFR